jgi:uncharacterized protein YfaP (DUF2135 family)
MRLVVLSLSVLLHGGCAHAQAQRDAPTIELPTIELPRGGWRSSAGEAAGFRQEVNYPASSVNAAGHGTAALIRGAIATHAKAGRTLGTLIVNGVAMPLPLDEAGRFERPYAFGAGANSVEVRAPDGRSRRVQFYDSYSARPEARLRVVLSWDSDGTDLDLHVVAPDGQHVFYGNRVADNGGALDVDVTTGYGPEIYANPAPPLGVYHVFVNYYGSAAGERSVTTARVTVVSQENTPGEKLRTLSVPLRKAGEVTLVTSFVYP